MLTQLWAMKQYNNIWKSIATQYESFKWVLDILVKKENSACLRTDFISCHQHYEGMPFFFVTQILSQMNTDISSPLGPWHLNFKNIQRSIILPTLFQYFVSFKTYSCIFGECLIGYILGRSVLILYAALVSVP